MDAYERLIGDAMVGDATLFARQDSAEAQWRIVDPILGDETPVHEYDRGTWGPEQAGEIAEERRWLARPAGDERTDAVARAKQDGKSS